MKALTKKVIRDAIEAWETGGRGGLTGPQQTLLVRLVTQDLRCANALQAHLRSEITERNLIRVLTTTWINEPLMHVEDNRPRLLQVARDADDPDRSVATLVLLATWLEHSLNIILVIGAARSGMGGKPLDDHAKRVGKDKMSCKLKIWRGYPGSPPLQDWMLVDLKDVFEQRNRAVHFRWIGDDHTVLQTRLRELLQATVKAWKLVDELDAIENRLSGRSAEKAALQFFST